MQDNQTIIHHHLRTISRINTGIALLSIVAVGAIYGWLKWFPPNTQNANTVQKETTATVVNQPSITLDEYQTQLNAIITGYEFNDAAVAQQKASAVLELRVPAEMKQLHMQVVLSLSDAQAGDTDEAQQRMNTLKQQYAWLAY